jgi:hypothetical protein
MLAFEGEEEENKGGAAKKSVAKGKKMAKDVTRGAFAKTV